MTIPSSIIRLRWKIGKSYGGTRECFFCLTFIDCEDTQNHRLQINGEIGSVVYVINTSKETWRQIELELGGKTKRLCFDTLIEVRNFVESYFNLLQIFINQIEHL